MYMALFEGIRTMRLLTVVVGIPVLDEIGHVLTCASVHLSTW